MSGDFYGLTTRTLSNEHLRLEYLAETGPRLVRLFLAGSEQNLLAEVPDISLETPYGPYYLRGGHRLWHGPETAARTYVPDNEALIVEEVEGGVRLSQPTEAPTGISKTIEVRLHAERPTLTLHHILQNDGLWPVQLAPWAITQLRLGGTAVLPQQTEALDQDGLQPNRHLVLWPYTRWRDPRLHLDDEYLMVNTQIHDFPVKIGYFNRRGWIGYLWQNTFFCKRFTPEPKRSHVDFGCNVEVYANDRFIELETLAPLSRLEPGESATHAEEWQIYGDVDEVESLGDIKDLIQALNL